MIDAVVGGVIMVVAASSLLFAVDVANRAYCQSGYYPLTGAEKVVLGRGLRKNPLDPADVEAFEALNGLTKKC